MIADLKKFSQDRSYSVGGNHISSRVSLLQFSTAVKQEWDLVTLEDQFAKGNFSAYDSLNWQMGVTNTHTAIGDGFSLVTAGTGARNSGLNKANKVMVVITDGAAVQPIPAVIAANASRAAGVFTYVIGFGPEIESHRPHLRSLAGGDQNLFTTTTFELFSVLNLMLAKLCADLPSDAPTPSPTSPPHTAPCNGLPTACCDGTQNGMETDTDCGGGVCEKCAGGKICEYNSDCASFGDGSDGTISFPVPAGVNPGESFQATNPRNGELVTLSVPVGFSAASIDYNAGAPLGCVDQHCPTPKPTAVPTPAPTANTCNDNELNGVESDTDCGGAVSSGCPRCAQSMKCNVHTDCASLNCQMMIIQLEGNNIAYRECGGFAPTKHPTPQMIPGFCSDGMKNEAETDVDCGGGFNYELVGSNRTCSTSGFSWYQAVEAATIEDCKTACNAIGQCGALTWNTLVVGVSNSSSRCGLYDTCANYESTSVGEMVYARRLPCLRCQSYDECTTSSDCLSQNCELKGSSAQPNRHLCIGLPVPTATPVVAPTSAPTQDCEYQNDWFVLVDSSSSIESNLKRGSDDSADDMWTANGEYTGATPHFRKVKEALGGFWGEIRFVNPPSAASPTSRVGLAQFSTANYNEWDLSTYQANLNGLVNATGRLRWRGGITNTGSAIEFAVQQLNTGPGSRGDVDARVLLIITDGMATDEAHATEQAAQACSDSGVLIYVIGYGNQTSEAELRALACGHSDRVFIAESPNQPLSVDLNLLPERLRNMNAAVCRDVKQKKNSIASAPTYQPSHAPTVAAPTPAQCANNRQDNGETDVDCGSVGVTGCPCCSHGSSCEVNDDCCDGACISNRCPTLSPTSSPTPYPTADPTNFPTAIPTLNPTPWPTSHPPTRYPTPYKTEQEWELNCSRLIDWYIVLDSSSSIEKDIDRDVAMQEGRFPSALTGDGAPDNAFVGYEGYTEHYSQVIYSLSNFTKRLTVGSPTEQTKVGLAQYSTNVYPGWDLGEFESKKSDLLNRFGDLKWQSGTTHTMEAISYAQAELMTGLGSRGYAHKVMLLVTDGLASNASGAEYMAKRARASGINFYAVGYGEEFQEEEFALGNDRNDAGRLHLSEMAGARRSFIAENPQCNEHCPCSHHDSSSPASWNLNSVLCNALNDMYFQVCQDLDQPAAILPTPMPSSTPSPTYTAICRDGIRNGLETDVDCGGFVCAPCKGLQTCEADSDCEGTLTCSVESLALSSSTNRKCSTFRPTSAPVFTPTPFPTRFPSIYAPTPRPTSGPSSVDAAPVNQVRTTIGMNGFTLTSGDANEFTLSHRQALQEALANWANAKGSGWGVPSRRALQQVVTKDDVFIDSPVVTAKGILVNARIVASSRIAAEAIAERVVLIGREGSGGTDEAGFEMELRTECNQLGVTLPVSFDSYLSTDVRVQEGDSWVKTLKTEAQISSDCNDWCEIQKSLWIIILVLALTFAICVGCYWGMGRRGSPNRIAEPEESPEKEQPAQRQPKANPKFTFFEAEKTEVGKTPIRAATLEAQLRDVQQPQNVRRPTGARPPMPPPMPPPMQQQRQLQQQQQQQMMMASPGYAWSQTENRFLYSPAGNASAMLQTARSNPQFYSPYNPQQQQLQWQPQQQQQQQQQQQHQQQQLQWQPQTPVQPHSGHQEAVTPAALAAIRSAPRTPGVGTPMMGSM
jgi:Mg-chelatase subunit ChlD